MMLRVLAQPMRRHLSTRALEIPAEVHALIEAEPSAEALQQQALGCLSGVHDRLPQLRSALSGALGFDANAVHVTSVLRALSDDASVAGRSRARAAMMLYHHHKERGEHDKCLMAAVATKVVLEEAFGTTKTVEYAAALGAQAQAAERLGRHGDAAHLMRFAASLVESDVPLVGRRLRHLGAAYLAEDGQHPAALHELRALVRELEAQLGPRHASAAIARANVARVELLSGNVELATAMLQEATHTMHASIGRAHPFARMTERLWAISELADVSTMAGSVLKELKENLPV